MKISQQTGDLEEGMKIFNSCEGVDDPNVFCEKWYCNDLK
jgi:hypothetical protein